MWIKPGQGLFLHVCVSDQGVLILACTGVRWFPTGTSGHYCHTGNTSNNIPTSTACGWAPKGAGVIWELKLIPF